MAPASTLQAELDKLNAMGHQVEQCSDSIRQAAQTLLLQLATVQASAKESPRDKVLDGFVAWVADTFKTKNVEGLQHLAKAYVLQDRLPFVQQFLEEAENVTIFSFYRDSQQAPERLAPTISDLVPSAQLALPPPSQAALPCPHVPTDAVPSSAPAPKPLQLTNEQGAVPPPPVATSVLALPPPPAPQAPDSSVAIGNAVLAMPPPVSTSETEPPKAKHPRDPEPLVTPRPSKKAKLSTKRPPRKIAPRISPTTRLHPALIEVISIDDDDDEDDDVDDAKDEDYQESSERSRDKPASAATDSASESAAPESPPPTTTRLRLIRGSSRTSTPKPASHKKKVRPASAASAAMHLLVPRASSTSRQSTTTEPVKDDAPDTEGALAITTTHPSTTSNGGPIHRLLHDSTDVVDLADVDVATVVKDAYAAVLAAKPWEAWSQHLRSFLPNTSPLRQQWNAMLADYFAKHAFTLWHRFFYSTAFPPAWPRPVDLDAAAVAAQNDLFRLAYELHKVEGDDVFKFLLRTPHPAWPTWLDQVVELCHVAPDDAVAYLKSHADRRWPQASRVNGANGLPHKDVFDPLVILAHTPDAAYLDLHKIPPKWAPALRKKLKEDSSYNVNECTYVCVTMYGEDQPVHLPNKVASAVVWDWDHEAAVPRTDVI